MPSCSCTSGIPTSWQASDTNWNVYSGDSVLTTSLTHCRLVWTERQFQNRYPKQHVHFLSMIQMKEQKYVPLTVVPCLGDFLKCYVCSAHTTMTRSHFSWKAFCYARAQSCSSRNIHSKFSHAQCFSSMASQRKKEEIVLQPSQGIEDAVAQTSYLCSAIWLRHDFPSRLPLIFWYLLWRWPGGSHAEDQNPSSSDLSKGMYSIHPSSKVQQLAKLS